MPFLSWFSKTFRIAWIYAVRQALRIQMNGPDQKCEFELRSQDFAQ